MLTERRVVQKTFVSRVLDKNSFIVWFFIFLLIVCSGCSYSAYKEYYTDTSKYAEIWNLAGIKSNVESGESIFPSNINGLNVEEYFCRYDEQLPLGEGIQILLKVKYISETTFLDEKKRVQAISYDCNAYFSTNEYSFYATHFAESGFFEYVAICQEDKIIYYLYIQDLPCEELEIDDTFIPDGYMDYGELKNTNP